MVLSSELITFTFFLNLILAAAGAREKVRKPSRGEAQPGDTPPPTGAPKVLLSSSALQTSSSQLPWAWPWAEHWNPPLALGAPRPDRLG